MKTKNTQIRTRINLENAENINKLCKERGLSRDSVVNSAIEEFFKLKELEGIDAVLERIGNLESKLKSVKTDMEVLTELVSFYVLYWFTYTPPLPESEIDQLTLQGFKRHKEFLAQLQRRLSKGEILTDKMLINNE